MTNDFPTVQDALEYIATWGPSMDELMSRRPEYPRRDIQFMIRVNRANRIAWQHNSDKRAEKKEENEE